MDHWLGSSYRVDERGARSQVGPSVSEIAWPEVKRVLAADRSIRLSPLAETGKLDAFRGVLLRTLNNNHAAVLEFVEKSCPAESILLPSVTENF